MLYLVGGVSRSGKSTLAERMRRGRGVPWFPLDALKMGLHLGAPSLEVSPDDEDALTAARMWPVIRPLLENLIFDGRDYLVEGVNLRPADVAGFVAGTREPVRACFLGYPALSVPAKAALVARHAGGPNDWLNRMGEPYVLAYLEGCVRRSRALRDECARSGLAFFDTGADFEAAIGAAERWLTRRP